ncbi:MAG: ATP-binding cassette domain-containing protein [Oscillospiraceae bacterium]|nr:ATP-binding cassette domain-containing protein [Oscillospiraceae bacterium]
MPQPIIQVKDLSKRFGSQDQEVRALEHIDLDIYPGDIFGIIGLSGAGKSTLVRCMNLLERPTEGSVIVDGQDLMQLSAKELRQARKSIGMIFQHFNLLMQRTCLDNITFPLELIGTPRKKAVERARELLKIVDLEDKEKAYPSQLSGGQKQRIAIARTLATNPKVLLCDEATSALDPKTTRDILRLIQDINKRLGITVVVITHDMKVIEEICGKVAILNKGHVAECGTVEDIFTNPQTEAGRRLVYPDGVPFDLLPASRVIRVAFNGGTAYQPLIASLAIDCGVKVNILGADTRNIDGKAFGTMLLGLPDNELEASKALSYIMAQKDITVEEVGEHG